MRDLEAKGNELSHYVDNDGLLWFFTEREAQDFADMINDVED